MTTPIKLPGIRDIVDVAEIENGIEAVDYVRNVETDGQQEIAIVKYDGADPRELPASAKAAGFHPGPPKSSLCPVATLRV